MLLCRSTCSLSLSLLSLSLSSLSLSLTLSLSLSHLSPLSLSLSLSLSHVWVIFQNNKLILASLLCITYLLLMSTSSCRWLLLGRLTLDWSTCTDRQSHFTLVQWLLAQKRNLPPSRSSSHWETTAIAFTNLELRGERQREQWFIKAVYFCKPVSQSDNYHHRPLTQFTLCVVHQRLSTTRPAVSCVGFSAPSKHCDSKNIFFLLMSVKLSFSNNYLSSKTPSSYCDPQTPTNASTWTPPPPSTPPPTPPKKKVWGWEVNYPHRALSQHMQSGWILSK